MNRKSLPELQSANMTAEDIFAVNPNIAGYEDHFIARSMSATVSLLPWFATVNSGSVALMSAVGGRALLTTAATTDDAIVNMQLNGAAYELADGQRVSFHATGVQVDSAAAAGVFVGLATSAVAVLTTDAAPNVADMVGFLWDGTKLYAVAIKDSAALTAVNKIDTGCVLSDATDVDLAFHFDGSGRIVFLVNDVTVATMTDTAAAITVYPDDAVLTPTVVAQEITSGARALQVDFVGAYQEL